MSIVVTAPESTQRLGFKVFLAGAIDMGQAVDWQAYAIDKFMEFRNMIVFNPRRAEFTPDTLDEQIEWELKALEDADAILMWLPKDAKAPVSMFEAGLYWKSGKLVVGAELGFYRRRNLEMTAAFFGTHLYGSLDAAIHQVQIRANYR